MPLYDARFGKQVAIVLRCKRWRTCRTLLGLSIKREFGLHEHSLMKIKEFLLVELVSL
jgi:hypothetical protein